MESFLAETVKYLWLLFDQPAGRDNLVENGPYKYKFSTEGHLLPMTPRISLVREHCSYFGPYCKSSDLRQDYPTSSCISKDANNTQFQKGLGSTNYVTKYTFHKSTSITGIIKGLCPGLTHDRMYGLLYVASPDVVHEDEPTDERENGGGQGQSQSQSMVMLSDSVSNHGPTESLILTQIKTSKFFLWRLGLLSVICVVVCTATLGF